MHALTDTQPQSTFADLNGWSLCDGRLHRKFEFDGFFAAFGFMSEVALLAEKANHHPEWKNVYNAIEVWLTTCDAGRATQKDVVLAKAISQTLGS